MTINTNFILYDLVYQGIQNNHRFVCSEKYRNEWHEIKADAFLNKIHAFALALDSLGVKKTDKIILHSENRIDWLIADIAITSIGAITIPIYTTQSQDQIEYIITHSEPVILIVSNKKTADIYEPLTVNHNFLAKISFDKIDNQDYFFYDDLIISGNKIYQEKPNLFYDLKSLVTLDDLITIAYTSGTTGTPKGVMLSHRNLAHSIQAPRTKTFLYKNLDLNNDVALSFLPFTHVFEHCAIYGYLTLGVPVYIISDVEKLPFALEALKPVHFTTVPRVLEKIYQTITGKIQNQKGFLGFVARRALKKIPSFKFNQKQSFLYSLYDTLVFKKIRTKMGGNIRGITSGGAALSPEIMQFFNAIGIPLAQGYGLTETSPGLTIYDFNHLQLLTAGKTLDGVALKIADDGEILAKGDNIMQGYFKEPDKTAEVLTADGWFHTGDIGHIDAQGFLFITDRKKELFKLSTGKYVAPSPLENKLVTIAGVDQAMIVGENEKFCAALIVPIAGYDSNLLEKNLKQAIISINKTVSPWEAIKKFVISQAPMTIESGELTPTHKKKRKIIAEKRKNDIQSLYQ